VWTHRSTTDSSTYASSWAPYHQTNSNMQKYPSGTIHRRPFQNTHGRDAHHCIPWNTKGRNCLNAFKKNWLEELANKIPEAKWEINYIHFWWGRLTVLWANVTPFPQLMQGVFCCLHSFSTFSIFILTPAPSHLELKRLLGLINKGNYPATAFANPHLTRPPR